MRFLKACRREPVDVTPVWIMRQAGRYLPEYREMRSRHTLLEICRSPELACEVAMQPLRRFDLDAAIVFSDLLIPLLAIDVDFDIVEKRGPIIARPIRSDAQVRALGPPDLRRVDFVFDTIRRMRGQLDGMRRFIPILGFAGAPFTTASYLIEGGPSRDFGQTKRLMYREPEVWRELLSKLSDLAFACLEAQVAAGAQAVQIFDSWIGCLGPADYRRYALEPTRRLFEAVARLGVPAIHFGVNTATLLELMAEAGGDVIGADWRVPLGAARRRLPGRAIQGNLDPMALMAPAPVLDEMIDDVLREAGASPGHIFNLGHGILPDTPIESVARLVGRVHEKTGDPRVDSPGRLDV